MRVTTLAVVVAVAALVVARTASAATCHALALSGGGNRGAYEAGVIQGLVDNLAANETQWRAVSGISAGAMNTVGISTFAVGDEKAMAQFLVNTISNLTEGDVFRQWPGGVLAGLFKERGLVDTTPLKNFIDGVLSKQGGIKDRKVVVSATNLDTGNLEHWNESSPDFATGALASASIPGMFPYVNARNAVYGDGGVVMSVDVFSAIERCLEVVSDPADIVVDIISCHSFKLSSVNPDKDTTLPVAFRALDIISYNHHVSDIKDVMDSYPTVNFRYNISPTVKLPGNLLDFDPTVLKAMVKVGYNDAIKAINGTA